MYRILVDTADPSKPVCLFDDRLIDQRVKVVDPVLELEDNASGSLEFTIYSTNQGYGTPDGETDDLLIVSSSTLRVYQDAEEIWEGRPLTIDTDFWNGKKITCEGALSYLNDIDQPYKEYVEYDRSTGKPNGKKLEIKTFIEGVLTAYNERASESRKFYVDGTYVNPIKIPTGYNLKGDVSSYSALPDSGQTDMDLYHTEDLDQYWLWYNSKWNDVTDNIHLTLGYRRSTGGESTKDAIFALVDDEQFGGHIKVVTDSQKRRCLYYTLAIDPEEEFILGSSTLPVQDVTFGKNLLDLTKTRDSTDFFTVLLPVGAEISADHPETIETMCLDILNDPSAFSTNKLSVTDSGTDIISDQTVPPYDATNIFGTVNDGESRRVFTVDIGTVNNGYDYFLYTSAYFRADKQGLDPEMLWPTDTICLYTLSDNSAKKGRIENTQTAGYSESGTTATFDNMRAVLSKTLPKTAYIRQTVNGDRISIPTTGNSTLAFSTAMDYAYYELKSTAGQNAGIGLPEVRSSGDINWDTWRYDPEHPDQQKTIKYPKLFRTPYPRASTIDSGVREIPADDIMWVGGSAGDPHWETSVNNEPYNTFGHDDCDIVPIGDDQPNSGAMRITVSNDKSANYINRFPPFGTDFIRGSSTYLPYPWNEHGAGNNPDWMFLTGYFGHHVARVMVEPGKTYFLNTRVTNPGFPDTSVYVEDQSRPYGSVRQAMDDGYSYEDAVNASVPENQWVFTELGVPKKRAYNDIFAYAVVACRLLRDYSSAADKQPNPVWGYEVVSYKLANKSTTATELMMERIEIPQAMFPERKVSFSEPGYDDKFHMEIWFTCDSCYINGTANLGSGGDGRISGDPNPINGYRPSIYVKDTNVLLDDQTQRDYHQCVSIAPLNTEQPEGYTSFPNEYLVNKDLADKYGVIIKRVDFEDAYTPSTLMLNAQRLMNLMTGSPSFEVSAIDLKECGLADCDHLRLLQKIKIDSDPHGIDSKVALSQMSINLADRESNTYTFGYEANKGISQM